MQSNFVRKKKFRKKKLCAIIQCRLLKHITIKLNETCYQQKTMSIDGLIYILMAFGEIKSRFQLFSICYICSISKSKQFFMTQVHVLANSENVLI